MDTVQSIFLGIMQGITEFLPISSSGHLVAVRWLFGWNDPGLTFDVALHLGTLAALVLFFWKDWLNILRNWKQPFLRYLIIGSVPAAAAGYLFEEYFDTVFRSPLYVGVLVIAMGLLMWAAELYGKKIKELGAVNLKDSVFVGCAQALALMPGVSRSGITITAGLFTGFTRETAARFSFLLAMPITFGAGLLKLAHIAKAGIPQNEYGAFAAGILCAAAAGFFAIKYLLKFLQGHSLYVFVWYRVLFGLVILTVYFVR